MSPASAKLNAFKERRFAKNAKPRTLFANTKSMSSDKLEGEFPYSSEAAAQHKSFDEIKEDSSKMSEG